MNLDSFVHVVGVVFQVSALDLLLSGDNALVIALACLSLPASIRGRAVMLGTAFAIVLRVILTGIVGYLLLVPYLKLLGGILLLAIAIKLLLQDEDEPASTPGSGAGTPHETQLMRAVMIVVSADLALSLDNVVAVAAAAQGSFLFMAVGLLLSMPLLMYGSLLLSRLLDSYPLLKPAGSALLGWIAGQIAISDPLFSDWVNTQSPALTFVVPLLCVVFVLIESRIIQQQSRLVEAPPPLALFAWLVRLLFPPEEAETSAQPAMAIMAAPSAPESVAALTVAPAPQAVVSEPAAPRRAPPVHTKDADPVNQSQRLALVIKLLLIAAVVAGAIALGWIVIHLFSQGIMPQPARPPQ